MSIHLKMTGGLGNQLFQLSALLNFSKMLELQPHASFNSTGTALRQFDSRGLLGPLNIAGCHKRCRFVRKKYSEDILVLLQEGAALGKNFRLTGYFQSSVFHENYIDSLILLLQNQTICCPLQNETSKAIGLHYRLGDYLNNQRANRYHGVLHSSYFQDAVNSIFTSLDDIAFIDVFSDSKTNSLEILSQVKLPRSVTLRFSSCINNSSMCDLVRMAQHPALVISNSSFSWWAARISGSHNIVAPSNWYRNNNPNYPIHERHWHTIDNDFFPFS